MDSNVKILESKQNCQEFMAFSSQSCQKETVAAAGSLTNALYAKGEHLWDIFYSWKSFFTPLLFSPNKRPLQLGGFIPGVVLNWINP